MTYLSGPLVVVAGPGSGKTRVLTHRVAYLLESGARPETILAVTFTNKAADEMAFRVRRMASPPPPGPAISTIHALCLRMLRAFGPRLGLGAFGVLDQADSERLMRDALKSAGLPATQARAYLGEISRLRGRRVSVEEAAVRSRQAKLAEVWEAYTMRKREVQAVDFDDMVEMSLELLSRHGDVLDRIRSRFRWVMVDEWQDTDRCQYEMLRLVASKHRRLCVVGDPQQAIYSWRGASPESFDWVESDFPDRKVVLLEENYRSTKTIVAAAQSLMSGNKFAMRLRTGNPLGEPVRLRVFDTSEAEASWVVSDLASLGPGTVGILTRTNEQTEPFEWELSRRGIPYQVVGAVPFHSRKAVKDVLAWMRVAVFHDDVLSVHRAASVPRRGVGRATLDALVAAARRLGTSPVALLLEGDESDWPVTGRRLEQVRSLATDIGKLVGLSESGPGAVAREVIEGLGVRAYLSGKLGDVDEDLDRLLAEAEGWPGSLAGFVEQAALRSSSDVEEKSRVSIVTAHAAKGREFDHVYVVGVEDDMYPHFLSRDDEEEVAEELRLLFVAVSRAKKTLTITRRRTRRAFDGRGWSERRTRPSRFLQLIPRELFDPLSPSPSHRVPPTRLRSPSTNAARPWSSSSAWTV